MSFRIKFQELNLNVSEEYKTECEAPDPDRSNRAPYWRAQTCERWECARKAGRFFSLSKPKVVHLCPFLSSLKFPKFWKPNFMYSGHKHVENGGNCSHKLATFLKYHMPLRSFHVLETVCGCTCSSASACANKKPSRETEWMDEKLFSVASYSELVARFIRIDSFYTLIRNKNKYS